MINEYDMVILKRDITPNGPRTTVMDVDGLKAGDVGVVINRHGDWKAFDVEFMTTDGYTIALVL